MYELIPILATGSHHAQHLIHSYLELFDGQKAVIGAVQAEEHLLHIDELARLHFQCGEQGDNSRLEHILLSKGGHVLNDLIRISLVQFYRWAVFRQPWVK